MEFLKNTVHEMDAPKKTTPAGSMEVENQRAISQVQASILLAKKFPRNPIEAKEKIMQACANPKLAENALYCFPRGRETVTGPSIRLAETLALHWGNMEVGFSELNTSPNEITVQAFAWDLESNVRNVKVFTVKNKRFTKSGSYDLTDPRDIYENMANQASRRLRACILAAIPSEIVDEAVQVCEKTLKLNVKVTPDKIKSLLEKFNALNVTQEMLEQKIQRRIDSITAMHMVQLGNIYRSITDNMAKPSDYFSVKSEDKKENNISTEIKKNIGD